MSIFNHNVANKDVNKEILTRAMQIAYLENLLELDKEELDADFNNLINGFNESIDEGLQEKLRACETSLSNYLEMRSELNVTREELEYAIGELKELTRDLKDR